MPGPEDPEDDIEQPNESSLDEFQDLVDSQLDQGDEQGDEQESDES